MGVPRELPGFPHDGSRAHMARPMLEPAMPVLAPRSPDMAVSARSRSGYARAALRALRTPRRRQAAAGGRGGRHAGQILVMFALMGTAMIGVMGLGTDLGYAFVAKRTMQNAADGAALAGARIVAKAATGGALSALGDVTLIANSNGFAGVNPTVETCQYVNDAGAELGPCGGTVPRAATGVTVTVAEAHPTFFLRAVPGAPESVTVRATATAHIRKATGLPTDGPFLVCGIDTKLAAGGRLSILQSDGSGGWRVKPDAWGRVFEIHGPQVERCNAKSSRFKGVADQGRNRTRQVADWFGYTEGDTAGPVSVDVEGVQGCKAGQEAVNCVAYLPVAVDSPAEANNDRQLWTVMFMPFYITRSGANSHYGELVPGYVIYNRGRPSTDGWNWDYAGPIVIRLTT